MNPMETQALVKECRNYYLNQAMVKAYEKADALRTIHRLSPAGKCARKQYEGMTVQIAHVDHIRSKIRQNFGIDAEHMFISCCIDGVNPKNVAARYELSDDVFRQKMNSWLELESEEEFR